MKLIYCLTTTLLLLTSCDHMHGGKKVNGDGHSTTESRRVEDYRKVSLEGDMDIEFTQGPLQDVVVEADENLQHYIDIRNSGDELIVGVKDGFWLSSHTGIKVRLHAPNVHGFSVPGHGNVILENGVQTNDPVSLNVSGDGNIKGAINSPSVKTDISGAGNVEVTGDTRDLDVNISGAGKYDGESLHSENAKVDISGAGDAKLHASVKLHATISGMGKVRYRGNPEVTSDVSGAGNIKQDN
jgi:hypothetical protein